MCKRATGRAFPVLIAWPGSAQAHAFLQRYDLPLPLGYYLAGAGLVVALSFVVAVLAIRPGRSIFDWRLRLYAFAVWHWLSEPAVRGPIEVLTMAAWLLVLAAGFWGIQGEPEQNLLPITVWVLWWVGLTFLCALAGDVWRLINPWAIVARWTVRLLRRGAPPKSAADTAVGSAWPAVALFFTFAWMELVWPYNAVPVKLAVAILSYSVVTWLGMAVMGVEPWLRRGEAFSLYFGVVARFAPLQSGGVLQPYGAGLAQAPTPDVSRFVFVLLMLATVSFDGLKETPWWGQVSASAMDALYRAGFLALLGNVAAGAVVTTVALVLTPLVLFILYWTACCGMAHLAGDPRLGAATLAREFALSLVPIAIAYHLAHYLSFLLVQGQAAVPLLSDPLNRGWDLFSTREYEPDIGFADARMVWTFSVVAIVTGHVAALLVAHYRALRVFADRRRAALSQYPMVALMVAYTMFSLWVLSQPIVQS